MLNLMMVQLQLQSQEVAVMDILLQEPYLLHRQAVEMLLSMAMIRRENV